MLELWTALAAWLLLFPALSAADLPKEILLRPNGPAFGLRANDPKPAGKWIERFEEWLADSGFLKKRDEAR